jgi:hypothetical protein
MKKKIAVVGIGTAGITTLCHYLAFTTNNCEIHSIYDPSIPILGIGESTQVTIPESLFDGARFSLMRDAKELDATIKHGVKYVDWRKHDMFSHILPPSHAMHFNNFKLKEFCFKRFKEIWKDKFIINECKVLDLINEDSCAKIITDSEVLTYDYIIDCRGYPEDYSDYEIVDSIPVNHCLVHMIPEAGNWNWTYHVAHRNGWMFGIPLTTRQGWGYLYNDTLTEKEDAIDDISSRFKVKKEDLNLREFSFKNYFAKKFIDHRIIKNGNRALFFEPLEAMSGLFYDNVNKLAFDYMFFNKPEQVANEQITNRAEIILDFIAFVYHGGSTFNSIFWETATKKSNERLEKRNFKSNFINEFKDKNMHDRTKREVFGIFTTPSWIDFDKQFNYNYITNQNESLEW